MNKIQMLITKTPTTEIKLLGWHHPVIIEEEELIKDFKKLMIKELKIKFSKGFTYNIIKLIPLEIKQWFKNNTLKGKRYTYAYVKPVHTRFLIINEKKVFLGRIK